jgi:glucosamine kinase
MSLFLGIDGGGSKTTCLVGDEKSVLATASAPGSNPIRVGEKQARDSLHTAIRDACLAAKVEPGSIQRTCVGIAGAGRPTIVTLVDRIVKEAVGGEIEVVPDVVVALEAAFACGPGLIVTAGTGSIAYGRNSRGDTARAGGWGFAISDEGSAHWIGRAAITAAMRSHDSGDITMLIGSILNNWHLDTRDELVRAANATPPPDFASLFPTVLAAAVSGDSLARDVLMAAGTELAQLAKIVVRRLWPEQQSLMVAVAGGVFQNSQLVRQVFVNCLRSEHPGATLQSGIIEPVQGALFLARRASTSRSVPSTGAEC